MTRTPSPPAVSDAIAFLQNPEIGQLLTAVSVRHVPRWKIVTGDSAGDLTPQDLFDIVSALRRASGITVPVPDFEGNHYWFNWTYDMHDRASALTCYGRDDSSLNARLGKSRNAEVLVKSRINETVAAALLDGLIIQPEQAYSLLELDKLPKSGPERLILNSMRLLTEINQHVDEPFTPELIESIRQRLLEGVKESKLKFSSPRQGTLRQENPDEEIRAHAREQLELICAYLNHESGDERDNPVLRALILPDLMRFYRPLESLNTQVGHLLMRLYTLKAGLPVLGMLPYLHAKLRWEEGKMYSSIVVTQRDDYDPSSPENYFDLTGYYTLQLELLQESLYATMWALDDLHRRDERIREILQHDPDLNHRQRSILGRAIKEPGSEFLIAYHKTKHNVVYATARADLLELVDRGYLVMKKRSRAFVFVPTDNLLDRIPK